MSKFKIAPQVTFSGLLVTAQPNEDVSIQPDKRRVEKLLAMPTPSDKEDVLSLLGLLATLMLWIPNLSVATEPIRDLIKKNAHYLWTPEHNSCLEEIKKKVNHHLVLSPFIPTRTSYIFTDASRQGIGYCSMQVCKNKWHFIRCASSTSTPSQKLYSTCH